MKLFKKLHSRRGLSTRAQAIILPILVSFGSAAVVLAVLSIVFTPKVNPGAERGVGADGFQAYVESDTDLGMGKIVKKTDVEAVLGKAAKSVSDVDVSKVVYIGGNRGQTATYNFVRTDGVKCSTYVDVMMFKNQTEFNNADVTKATLKASLVKGNQSYYMHALTLGSTREYRLMIVKGLSVYKFVIVQPVRNIAISEVTALSMMNKLASQSDI